MNRIMKNWHPQQAVVIVEHGGVKVYQGDVKVVNFDVERKPVVLIAVIFDWVCPCCQMENSTKKFTKTVVCHFCGELHQVDKRMEVRKDDGEEM